MKKTVLALFIFFIPFIALSQLTSLSDTAEISIITIGPGDELYDSFGHSAIRLKDTATAKDIVFNYGTFDFDTPNFYIKFARGKLPYALSVRSYKNFINNYIVQKRWVKEQVLNLSYGDKKVIFDFLLNNAQPENKEYAYDFFFDNCATRVRDVLVVSLKDKLSYNDEAYVPEPYTFRNLIQQRLYWNTWGSVGIDIALGAIIDRTASPWEHQYLPDYIFDANAAASISRNGNKQPLVSNTSTLNEAGPRVQKELFVVSPLCIFILLALGILYITFQDQKNNTRTRWLDGMLFLITGVVGILLLPLWVGTDHTATANNYNLLWAFPLNLFFCGLIWNKTPKKWLRKYLFLLSLLLVLLTIHWFTGVQVFAYALIPLLVALAIRYSYVSWYLKKNIPN